MTQSLLNLMNSPLMIAAVILWLLLFGLVLRQCQRWAKGRNKERVIHQNHPAIPVKVYKLSDFEAEADSKPKPINPKSLSYPAAVERTVQPPSPNVWDI